MLKCLITPVRITLGCSSVRTILGAGVQKISVSVIKKNEELLLQYREANKLNARIVLVVVRRRRRRRRRVVGAVVFVIAWQVCELERKRRRARCPDLGPAVPVPVPVLVLVLVFVVGRRGRGRLVVAVVV